MKVFLSSSVLFVLLFSGLNFSGPAAAQTGASNDAARSELSNMLPNFSVVTPGMLRGGQPTVVGLNGLKNSGVKTIVCLRNEEKLVGREAKAAHGMGLKFENIPLDVFNQPSDDSIRKFLSVVSNPDNQPVYVHCLHGQDRTGAMVAIYRMQNQGWTAEQAYQEMLQIGFRPGLVHLSDAVFAWAQRLGRPGIKPPATLIVNDMRRRFSQMFKK